ncbi:hypothetical protein L3X07_02745 [Levilactobacillus brevis]|nr:hypothetical protein [Levilactobacillus brevis]
MQFRHHRLTALAVVSLAVLTVGLAGCSSTKSASSSYKIKNNKVALTTAQIKKNLDTQIITTRQDKQKA